MRRQRTTLLGLAVVAVGLLMTATPVGAQEDVISIPITDVERGPEGSLIEIVTVEVDPELQGLTCSGDAIATNQESVHPNNDLIISTGDTSATIEDVEDEPGGTKEIIGDVVLGPTITVSLLMGPDEVFSGGLTVSLDCTGAAATTTTAPPETTESPTTTEATTTTEPPTETSEAAQESTTTTEGSGTGTDELPNTGSTGTGMLVILGVGLLATGLVLVARGRGQASWV